jgi:hypothetical protein
LRASGADAKLAGEMTLDEASPRPEGAAARACLAACCALALDVLRGEDAARARGALGRALAAIPGGATFGNARTLLARLFGVRSEVVSGRLEGMLELNGACGLLILGVNPRLLYPGASPGRHAVVLASCPGPTPPGWGRGLLVVERAQPAEILWIVDPQRTTAPEAIARSTLAAAFDAAGREALLVEATQSL